MILHYRAPYLKNLTVSAYPYVVALVGTSMSHEQEKLIVEAVGKNGG